MFAFLFLTLGKIFEKGAMRWGQILHILIMFVKLFVSFFWLVLVNANKFL